MMIANTQLLSDPQLPNGELSQSQEEEMKNQQFLWTTDTVVINGNQVKVIFPKNDQEQ